METPHFSNSNGPEGDKSSSKDEKDTKKSSAKSSFKLFERDEPKSATEIDKPERSFFKLFERDKEDADATPAIDQKEESVQDPERNQEQPELSDTERLEVAQRTAEARQPELAEESETVTDEAELASVEAATAFYDKIINQDMQPEEAAAETMAELGADEPAPEVVPEVSEDESEPAPENEEEPAPPISTSGSSSGGAPPPTGNLPPNSPPPPTIPPNNTPPIGSIPANGPLPPHQTYAGPVAPSIQNQQPVTRTEYVPYVDRSRAFGDALVGGIVGYFIGRRRGRIKTERKLLPVQRKLEREVKTLTQTIARQEFTIRQAASEKIRRPLQVAEQPKRQSNETVVIDRRERPLPAPELHHKPSSLPKPERIGKVLVAAEVAPRPTKLVERQPEAPKPSAETIEKQVATLTRNELLSLSEKVVVEGSTLRQVYETHLVSERGLRRLVTEYLRGGDVQRAFKRELVEREIDFERDPILRDNVRRQLKGSSTGNSSPTLQKMLAQAGVAADENTAQDLARARAQQLKDVRQQSKQHKRRVAADVSLITIIAVLLAIITILAIERM